ncbi:hypothetical protein MNBD_ALPHA04-526, partial [hydrothermal vent metagenome]
MPGLVLAAQAPAQRAGYPVAANAPYCGFLDYRDKPGNEEFFFGCHPGKTMRSNSEAVAR